MSLRTDYTGAIDTALSAARAAGNTSVTVTNIAAITSAMAAAAASGKKQFTVTIQATFQPQDLRLQGPLWLAYKSGLLQGLHGEDLMEGDVAIAIDLSDTVDTAISLNFTF